MPQQHPHNPMTGEMDIVLSDGIPRRLKLDLNAMILVEQALKANVLGGVSVPRFALLRALVWAGVCAAMEEPPGDWTLHKAGSLMGPGTIAKYAPQLDQLFAEAVAGPGSELVGETNAGAAGAGAPAKESRGTGRRR